MNPAFPNPMTEVSLKIKEKLNDTSKVFIYGKKPQTFHAEKCGQVIARAKVSDISLFEITYKEAISRGLIPCFNCYKHFL